VNLWQASTVVFDNDGTLYPSGPAVGRAVLQAHRRYVAEHGLDVPTPDMQWLEHMIGADAREFYGAMMPDQPESVRREFEEFCLDYERRAVREHPYMYEGAEEVLSALAAAGRQLVLVTNGGPSYVRHIWDACDYGRFFQASYAYGPPDYASKAERLRRAVADWGRPAVMIGDRASDRSAAEQVGIGFIGCAYGYAGPDELAGATHVVADISELYNLLLAPEERKRCDE
jgi:phosphoglycolate phosphatase